jgi:leucyl/phenylalanyl-tRNA--protein transferase
MPVYLLDNEIWFPPHGESDTDVMAIGGDLSEARLITAYSHGIFPWYDDVDEILWWSPKERCVIFTDEVKISKSMRNIINRGEFKCTFDLAFRDVVEGCRSGERVGNTWIHDEVLEAYSKLHELGLAHSVEVWQQGKLVGGLYGVSLGHVFFGESMFSKVSNSSKFAFIKLAQMLHSNGWKLIDCQIHNSHLESLGARNIDRKEFLDILEVELKYPTQQGKWTISKK